MSERKGFFSFFKGKSKSVTVFSEEEEKQRSYAIAKEQEERQQQIQLEKEAKIVKPQPPKPSDLPPTELSTFAQEKLEELLRLTQFGGQVILVDHSPERVSLNIVNSDDAGRIIGKDGCTLEAFQTLLRGFIYKKFSTPVRVTIDIGDYRKKKEDILKIQAEKAAKAVLRDGNKYELRHMSAEERRIVHTLFQNDDKIKSYSIGEGQDRHIVLELKEYERV